jgi:rRNA maturation endonuclease Nob1
VDNSILNSGLENPFAIVNKNQPEDLNKVAPGRGFFKHCNNCGYETSEDFDFCPKCGMKF